MSIAIGFFDEDGAERRRPKKVKRAATESTAVARDQNDNFSILQHSAIEPETLQKIWETLVDTRTKVMSLEENVLVAIHRQSGVERVSGHSAPPKEFYTTEEFAGVSGLLPDTITTYCRLGKLNATKTVVGRGATGEWRISHAERLRYEKEGLLREDRPRRRPPRRFGS
jgi:hypothetical protein